MKFNLNRDDATLNGIFGTFSQEDGGFSCVTAEHSYDGEPKLPDGSYTCVKGKHTLEHHPDPFDAFEITNVPGHTNILLHIGNAPQQDSAGCVLLGQDRTGIVITNSSITFNKFMILMANEESFTLVVTSFPPMPTDDEIKKDLEDHE